MGLFQSAFETFDTLEKSGFVGKYETVKEPLCPVGHIIAKADIEVMISAAGEYVSSRFMQTDQNEKNRNKVIIPVTEKSGGRTGKNAYQMPHPLCDQLKYLTSYDKKSEESQRIYLNQLEKWKDSEFSDPKLEAVYRYVEKNSLLQDLSAAGLLELNKDGKPSKDNFMIVWNVLDLGSPSEVYKDVTLMNLYTKYYQSKSSELPKGICAITGRYGPLASQHLKGVFSLNGNAKLISANDNINFTFRGRFNTAEEALSIGYEASQKSHNALKWLIGNHGTVFGGRSFLCWSPQGDHIPSAVNQITSAFFGTGRIPESKIFPDYRKVLNLAIAGYKSGIRDLVSSKTVIACFDAATTGRLAVTFYSEMFTREFLRRLRDWDEQCCWYGSYGNITSPSIYQIAQYAFGTERDRSQKGRVEMDDTICRQAVDRLLHCRIGEELFPVDVERKLVYNASRLNLYGSSTRRLLLSTACAVIRKHYFDHEGKEFSMELEENRHDRSYQFGRLLAVYEKIETDTYAEDEKREPNAMRLQSVYCNRPMYYAGELEKQMEKAYFPKIQTGARVFYKKLISDILSEINEFPQEEWNHPLKDTYLMGYYLQRKKLWTKRNDKNKDEGNED